MRAVLTILGLVGLLLFGAAFATTFASPITVERTATAFIRGQIERRIDERIDSLGGTALKRAASRLSGTYADEAAEVERQLRSQVPEQIAAAIARMQDLSCECRGRLAVALRAGFVSRMDRLETLKEQLGSFVESSYEDIAQELLRDLRIFTGATAAAFLLVVVLALTKTRATRHLVLPAALLLTASCVSAFVYLFEQNWFSTIVFDDYVGLGYVAYLAGSFALLCDIALNRARVTTRIVNAALDAVGGAATLAPC